MECRRTLLYEDEHWEDHPQSFVSIKWHLADEGRAWVPSKFIERRDKEHKSSQN